MNTNSNKEIQDLEKLNTNNKFSNLTICNYKYPETIRTKGFSILTLNIRSLKKNLDNLKTLVDNLDNKIDIIALTETWDTSKLNMNIPKYRTPITTNRTKKKGGGLCIYIKENLQYNILRDSEIIDKDIECIAIQKDN